MADTRAALPGRHRGRAAGAAGRHRRPAPPARRGGDASPGTHLTAPVWVASASDICRAYTSLAALTRRPGLSPIGLVLSLNDLGLDLDPAQWRTTWYKGGVAPGAVSYASLATPHAGQSYVITVLAENPIDADRGAAILLSAIKGA